MIARRIVLALLVSAQAGAALAQPPPGRGQGGPPGRGGPPAGRADPPDRGAPDAAAAGALGALVAFTALEQARIRAGFIAHPHPVQPLPPGIARNLARGRPLPPGIARRYAPAGLIGQLAPRPGFEVLVAGASILLVHAASGIVHDILSDAVRAR
jgi:hypothetical protein